MQYASDATMKIVFSCCQPSLLVCYDTVQGIHSVWLLRKVTSVVSDGTHSHIQRGREDLSLTSTFFPQNQECSSVLRCPADPVGTPLRLMASGFLTSHLRNMSHVDSPGVSGSHGFGSGTGPRYVTCF